MSGETNLNTLISSMTPTLSEQEYVFGTLEQFSADLFDTLAPISIFAEKEGIAVIAPKQQADINQFEYSSTFRCITLTVHSSLNAVGLTAAVSTALANAGISANVVAAYYHDHIFVPQKDAIRALEVLQELQKQHES